MIQRIPTNKQQNKHQTPSNSELEWTFLQKKNIYDQQVYEKIIKVTDQENANQMQIKPSMEDRPWYL